MEVAGVREMSAPLIGTRGNCSLVCQFVVVNYWYLRGKEPGTFWDSAHQRHCRDIKDAVKIKHYLA